MVIMYSNYSTSTSHSLMINDRTLVQFQEKKSKAEGLEVSCITSVLLKDDTLRCLKSPTTVYFVGRLKAVGAAGTLGLQSFGTTSKLHKNNTPGL